MRQTRPWARGKWTPVIVYGRIVIRTCFLWVHHASTSKSELRREWVWKEIKNLCFHVTSVTLNLSRNCKFVAYLLNFLLYLFFSKNKILQLFHLLAVRKLRAVDGKFSLITRGISDLYNPNEKRARALTSTPVSHERVSWEFVMLLSNVGDENCYLSLIVTIKWFLFLGLLGC